MSRSLGRAPDATGSVRRTVVAASLAALAALATFAGAPAGAQDGDEGDGPAPPAEPPSMETAVEQRDGKGVLSVKLPKEWKSQKRDNPARGELASFTGPYTTQDAGAVFLVVDTTSARAAATLAQILGTGKVQASEARSGPGWWEGATLEDAGNPPLSKWVRCFEKDGHVYVVQVLAHRNSYERAKGIARQILDTAKVTGSFPREGIPKGWSSKKAGEFDVWTDGSDAGKAAKPTSILSDVRSVLSKSVKGKPYDESRPVVKSYDDAGKFADDAKAIYGEAPRHAAWDPYSRSVMVKLLNVTMDDFPGEVRSNAARQWLFQYFGGRAPYWMETGLTAYGAIGAESGGKPQSPPKAAVQKAKSAVAAGKRNFDAWLASAGGSDVPDVEQAQWELWAWHQFIRHGAGKKYRKAYDASIDAVRATGDPAAAVKAWEGTDFDTMTKEFRDWAADWEP